MAINLMKTQLLDNITSGTGFVLPVTSVPTSSKVKLLGLEITDKLKWSEQISSACKRASRLLFTIVQLRRSNCLPDTMWHVYYALVRSILVYGYPVMCNMPATHFQRLLDVEKRAKKIIGKPPPKNLQDFCDESCKRIVVAVERSVDHPLRCLLRKPEEINNNYNLRRHSSLKPFARTERLKNSFTKYLE